MSRQRAAILVISIVLPVVAVVAVVARGGDGGPQPLPVLAGGGGDAALASEAAIYPRGPITYEAAADLPVLDGSSRAYRLESVGEDGARRIAGAFGLEDALEADGGGGWTAVEGDRTLSVYPDALSWSYYAADAMSAAGSGVGGDSGSGCSGPDCSVSSAPVTTVPPPPPERPSDLPSRDEAESIARAVLAETGVAIDGASVDAFDNTLSWSFTFDPVVDGLPTYGFNSSVSIGAGGEVIDGYGVIGTPTAGDEYPLIGTPAAVERLNRGEAFGPSVAATATLETAVADAAPPETATTILDGTDTTACPDVEPRPSYCGDGTVSDVPLFCPPEGAGAPTTFFRDPACDEIEPLPEPDAIVFTLTGAEAVLAFLPAVDGSGGWLVPAYRFTRAEGGSEIVIAVADEFLVGADGDVPPATEPGSDGTGQVEPGSDGTGQIEPGSVGTGDDPVPPAGELETRPTVAPDAPDD